MLIVITGLPGSGKTTLCKKIYEEFKSIVNISGFITEEIREYGRRVGFIAKRLDKKEEIILAHINYYEKSKYRVGKYGVDVEAFEKFILNLEPELRSSKFIIIDEIGKMELFSQSFEKLILNLINFYKEEKILLFTVHYTYNHPLCVNLREEWFDEKFIITRENRERLFFQLKELLKSFLQ